jgi:hypothetical protein
MHEMDTTVPVFFALTVITLIAGMQLLLLLQQRRQAILHLQQQLLQMVTTRMIDLSSERCIHRSVHKDKSLRTGMISKHKNASWSKS